MSIFGHLLGDVCGLLFPFACAIVTEAKPPLPLPYWPFAFLHKLVVFLGLSAGLSAYSFPLKYLPFRVWPVRILCMLFMSLFSCLPHCEIVPSFALGPLVLVTVFSDLKMSACVFLWHTLFICRLSPCFPPSPSDPFSSRSSHFLSFFPGAALPPFIFFPPFLTREE